MHAQQDSYHKVHTQALHRLLQEQREGPRESAHALLTWRLMTRARYQISGTFLATIVTTMSISIVHTSQDRVPSAQQPLHKGLQHQQCLTMSSKTCIHAQHLSAGSETTGVLQCFDASQPTASQLVPKPHSPEASLPSQSPKASAVLESPGVSPPPRQQQQRQGQAASHEEDRLRTAHELDTRQEEPGAVEADPNMPNSAAGQSEAEAAPAEADTWCSGAVPVVPENAGASAAGTANAEALAALPVVPLGQLASPASSSDLRLETFLGAAPAVHSAPAHVAGSPQGNPDRRAPGAAAASRHVAPSRETAAASADSSARAQPAGPALAAAAGQVLPVREVAAVEIDSGSDNEQEEPLWEPEPEPAPRPPAGCATTTILEIVLGQCFAQYLRACPEAHALLTQCATGLQGWQHGLLRFCAMHGQ